MTLNKPLDQKAGPAPGRPDGKNSSQSRRKTGGKARLTAEARRLDRTLAELSSLEARIHAITSAINSRIAFSTSLGIEDQVVLHAIAATKAPIDIVTLDTGRHFPETLDTVRESELRYGVKIRVVAPDTKEVEALVARDGLFGFRDAVENRIACCNVRKVRPLARALKGAGGWITGLRRSQSDDRSATPFAVYDPVHRLLKVNPLADWSLERVEAFVKANNVPVNPLYAKGYLSIGCQPCTRAVRPGEDVRAGRWWWENEDGKECGLHNRPKSKDIAA